MSLRISNFTATNQTQGGQTPSFQAKMNGREELGRYQIKRSNNIRWYRRWFGYDPDQSDILGEYIASRVIAKSLNTPGTEPELAPEVSLVANPAQKDFSLASRYLNDTERGREAYAGMTLLELTEAKDGKKTANRKKNKLVIGKAEENQLSITEPFEVEIDGEKRTLTMDKKELYDSLAASIILADHDVNPGNFYAIIDKEHDKLHIGRIDMGHAFNDLIKSTNPWKQSPNILGGRNSLLDTLNRTTDNSGVAKLSRHFDDNILLDPEFAESLRKQEINIREELDSCKNELKDLILEDKNIRKAVIQSAITLCKRQGDPLTKQELRQKTWGQWFYDLIFKSKDQKEREDIERANAILDTTIEKTATFVEDNQKEANSVANLIDVQAKVKEMFKLASIKDLSKEELQSMVNEIKEIYAKDKMYLKDKSLDDPIEWVRTEHSSIPDGEKVSLSEYVDRLGEQFGNHDLANQFKEQVDISIAREEQRGVSAELHKSTEISHSASLERESPIPDIRHSGKAQPKKASPLFSEHHLIEESAGMDMEAIEIPSEKRKTPATKPPKAAAKQTTAPRNIAFKRRISGTSREEAHAPSKESKIPSRHHAKSHSWGDRMRKESQHTGQAIAVR